MVTISSGRLPDAHTAAYTGGELNVRGEDPVPLSEEELRALEQMERALVQEDPKLASTLRGTNLRRAAQRRAILSGICFVAGLAVLMAGAVARMTVVGVLGFVIMLVSASIGLAAIRGTSSKAGTTSRSGQQPGSMLDRFGTPWRRRHDGDA
jgi:Protein of unknown function (DUF3040)